MTRFGLMAASIVFAASIATQAAAAEKLTLYCSTEEDWCQVMARGFEEATGIDVNMTRKSSGETYAQVKAESANPKGDIWWGGTGDPHLQAAEEGLTEPYVTPMRGEGALRAIIAAQAADLARKDFEVRSQALAMLRLTRFGARSEQINQAIEQLKLAIEFTGETAGPADYLSDWAIYTRILHRALQSRER